MLSKMSDELYVKIKYKTSTGEILRLDNPRSFNEKLQWLKLNDKNPEYVIDVDKYLVRQKISTQIGEQYLIPLIGVYDSPKEIDFANLPDSFVLKCNHGTHCSIICKDKNSFKKEEAVRKLSSWMKKNYYYVKI